MQPLLKLSPSPGIDDVLLFQPAAPRLVNAILPIPEIRRAVRVAANRDLHSQLARPAHLRIAQSEPFRLRLEFQGDVVLFSGLKHCFKIHRNGLSLIDEPHRRMRQNVDRWMRKRLDSRATLC